MACARAATSSRSTTAPAATGPTLAPFWYDEYLLNAYIGRYPKPYVALMDGIVMGGGVGVSAHGSVRVVTDTTKMAMPEVGIGFIPDVGGTYLSRAPGLLGLHAALTGAPFGAADAIAMGFADHYVPHDKLAEFKDAIIADGIDAALAAHATEPPASRASGTTGVDRRVLRGRDRRRTSSPRCAATTRARPTTRPT